MRCALVLPVLATAAVACDRGSRASDVTPGAGERTGIDTVVEPDSAGLARSRIGVVFDPAVVTVGDTIGALVLARVDARATPIDSTWVGFAAFDGSIQLDGMTIVHHEHPEVQANCFEADSASAERLPRWKGDRRRAWFCVTNGPDATRLLAAPGVVRRATIVIDSFTIYRGLSDETNSARLVRVPAADPMK